MGSFSFTQKGKNMTTKRTWTDAEKLFPELKAPNGLNRSNMTYEREKEWVDFCFEAYENDGFSETYEGPYDQYEQYKGMKFTVDGRVSDENGEVDLEVLPLWHITLENGEKITAFPEEICLTEMNKNMSRRQWGVRTA